MVNKEQQILKKIQQKELQIKKLVQQDIENEVCADLFNSLILQKAILKKELDDLRKNPILEKIKRIIPHKEKLICDYFK